MAASHPKRLFTDDPRLPRATPDVPHAYSTDPDLVARLRGVASRVRHSVATGYRTPPNSTFQRAHSTGHIFRSAGDTLRDVFDAPIDPPPLADSTKKRARTQSDQGYNSDGSVTEDDNPMDQYQNQNEAAALTRPDRPIKALRKPKRTMLVTHSLPAGALSLGNLHLDNDIAMDSLEEEDWTIPAEQSTARQTTSGDLEPVPLF